ncbi:hypothetical protein BX600DRAFT_470985 [Xylariales sp. PMI_506]|nr:hypothetical protein BX600DRAFT_470985 [Xylariales sp. PMI_506]
MIMAGDGSEIAEPKKIHPFFSAPKDLTQLSVRPITPDSSGSPHSERTTEKIDPAEPTSADDCESGEDRRKRQKIESVPAVKRLDKLGARAKRKPRASVGGNIAEHFGLKQNDVETSAATVEDVENIDDAGAMLDVNFNSLVEQQGQLLQQPVDLSQAGNNEKPEQPLPLVHAPQPVLNADNISVLDSSTKQETEAKPPKLLQFNPKTGTIGPPPKQKESQDKVVPAKRGRKKKVTSLVVLIPYGPDDASRCRIGEGIDAILSGVRHIVPAPGTASELDSSVPSNLSATTPSSQQSRGASKKTPHPFFSGKPKSISTSRESKLNPKSPGKTQSIFTSTPCSPKRSKQPPPKFNLPQFGMKSGGVKVPGAQHPAWPWKGIVHVHGDGRDLETTDCQILATKPGSRKAKGRAIGLQSGESVIDRAASTLKVKDLVEELNKLSADEFQPPAPILRIPGQSFESGKKLQARILPELRTLYPGRQMKTHPAIIYAYNMLATSLSAFDLSTCECVAWTHKYAPITADCVLQGGREAELLREWLRALQVQAVDTGPSEGGTSKTKTAPPKRRKRKKTDDFVVYSDDEDGEMDEISDPEPTWTPSGSQGDVKRTVVRSGKGKGNRLTNGVLLSGPHGCGKTATVYAIAKELDFEVFEIGPGSRRNGKDILEKIGDMTRNHLVQHNKETVQTEENPDDEVARDLKSGKQGMMTAFFKPKTGAPPPKVSNPPTEVPVQPNPDKPIKKPPGKSQKQSLILLEEIDILYEEDKQFWATVIGLMAQSKRPFIMTCNDESLVPFQTLSLYGIFRFNAAPKELAIDLLLLIAANEGHALKRQAVEALYESRGCDLRATITELNYWCQIGVGDVKGGFGWFYRKWPRGTDVDDHGDRIRVISSDTYRLGMGWLGRDAILAPCSYRGADEEFIHQSWDNWSLDPTDFEISADSALAAQNTTKAEQMATLGALDAFYESMGAADLISCGSYSFLNQVTLDPTQPDLTGKPKDDFIIGLQFLDAPMMVNHEATSPELAASLTSLSRACLGITEVASLTESYPLNESKATQKIQHSFTYPRCSKPVISRADYSLAFDPIAASEDPIPFTSGHLDPSVFDRTMKMITLDVAPYVRSIIAYDQRLQAERLQRSSLLSEGGNPKKKMRTTRSALSALEGGARSSTRRERYFSADINPHLVMRTGGKNWVLPDMTLMAADTSSPCSTTLDSSDGEVEISGGAY